VLQHNRPDTVRLFFRLRHRIVVGWRVAQVDFDDTAVNLTVQRIHVYTALQNDQVVADKITFKDAQVQLSSSHPTHHHVLNIVNVILGPHALKPLRRAQQMLRALALSFRRLICALFLPVFLSAD
jgi:hypothetical protein